MLSPRLVHSLLCPVLGAVPSHLGIGLLPTQRTVRLAAGEMVGTWWLAAPLQNSLTRVSGLHEVISLQARPVDTQVRPVDTERRSLLSRLTRRGVAR